MRREARRSEANRAEDTRAVHLWLVLWKAFRSVEAQHMQFVERNVPVHRRGQTADDLREVGGLGHEPGDRG